LLVALTVFAGCADTIHNEAARGDLDALRSRLSSDSDACEARNREGKTALHYAINFAQRDAFVLLTESGQCDVNATDHTGMTPLHCAASIGLPAAVPMLLGTGADLEARDEFGDTPLHTAAMKGYVDMVQALIEAGADTAVQNKDGRTPEQLAEFYGQAEAAAFLQSVR
jgi:ankyrin repeat protein